MSPARPRRLAMLGGTFDPVHLGHLRSAVELREALGLDEVRLIPAARPPLRDDPRVTSTTRLALLRLGIGETPGLVADDCELARQGPSYSADTLAALREEVGTEARLVMALGHDAFLRLADWHAPERLFDLAHLVVIDRPDHPSPPSAGLKRLIAGRDVDDTATLMARPAGGLLRLSLPTRLAISATAIRRRLAEGRSVRYLLPEAVETRIREAGLYRV